ncbi:GNAT family N-acetyltransferase [Lysobacter fragariae]
MDELDTRTYDAWTGLAARACEPNPFLMPQFVLPAARWLSPRPPLLALFERGAAHELVGVGCFSAERANPFAPVPHLRAFCTLHSFRTGLLVASGEAAAVAHALLAAMRERKGAMRHRAIALRAVPAGDEGYIALRAVAAEAGGGWRELSRFARPVLRLAPGLAVLAALPGHMLKDLRRRRRRLHEAGPCSVRLVQAARLLPEACERHLALEHGGWKGAHGSSLLSSVAGVGFFREVVERFGAIGAVVFTELLSGDRVIGSSSNFLVGRTLSAFKIGWHSGFARYSPGRLTELALLESIPATWPHVDKFDSNSGQDSFLSRMLPHAEPIVSGFVATDPRGLQALHLGRLMHPFARALGLQPWQVDAGASTVPADAGLTMLLRKVGLRAHS